MTLQETIQTLTHLHASLLSSYGDDRGGYLLDHGEITIQGDKVTLADSGACLALTKEAIEQLPDPMFGR